MVLFIFHRAQKPADQLHPFLWVKLKFLSLDIPWGQASSLSSSSVILMKASKSFMLAFSSARHITWACSPAKCLIKYSCVNSVRLTVLVFCYTMSLIVVSLFEIYLFIALSSVEYCYFLPFVLFFLFVCFWQRKVKKQVRSFIGRKCVKRQGLASLD